MAAKGEILEEWKIQIANLTTITFLWILYLIPLLYFWWSLSPPVYLSRSLPFLPRGASVFSSLVFTTANCSLSLHNLRVNQNRIHLVSPSSSTSYTPPPAR